MTVLRKISNYWWCQLAGWGLVAISFPLAFFAFNRPITGELVLKSLVVMASGIISTHLLRFLIKKFNWLLMPIEKIILD